MQPVLQHVMDQLFRLHSSAAEAETGVSEEAGCLNAGQQALTLL